MADKFIDSKILNKLYSGKTLTDEEWDEYLKWREPEDDEYNEKALEEAKKSVEGEVFGMYGNLAKHYCLEGNPEKGARIGKDLAEYLHEVDKAAEEMLNVLEDKYSEDERFKRTGTYIEDVRRANQKNDLIREEILNSLVYVD